MAKYRGVVQYGDYTVNYSYGFNIIKNINVSMCICLEKIFYINEFKDTEIISPLKVQVKTLDIIATLCYHDLEIKKGELYKKNINNFMK